MKGQMLISSIQLSKRNNITETLQITRSLIKNSFSFTSMLQNKNRSILQRILIFRFTDTSTTQLIEKRSQICWMNLEFIKGLHKRLISNSLELKRKSKCVGSSYTVFFSILNYSTYFV